MTTANARRAFVRSYHLPTILTHYPRLVRAMRGVVALNGVEAAICIRPQGRSQVEWRGRQSLWRNAQSCGGRVERP
jgi:hypothetical protein